jgi:hypothetical protein
MINNAARKRERKLDGFLGTLWICIVGLREIRALERRLLEPVEYGNRATYDELLSALFIAIAILYPDGGSGDRKLTLGRVTSSTGDWGCTLFQKFADVSKRRQLTRNPIGSATVRERML